MNKVNIQLTSEEIEAYQQGKSALSIAKKRKISSEIIIKLLKAAGVETRSRKRKFTLEDRDIQDHHNGKSINAIAREKGAKPATISRLFKESGFQTNREGYRKNPETSMLVISKEDIDSYNKGETTISIAKRNNTTIAQVAYCLRKSRSQIRCRKSRVTLPQDKINNYLAGESTKSIAERSNCTNPTIIRLLKKAGVQIRRGRSPSNTD